MRRMTSANQAVMFDPSSPGFFEDPYPHYARLREAAAVVPTPYGGWLVTRYEAADHVLRSPAFRTPRGNPSAGSPGGPSRFAPDGKLSLHRQLWLLFQSGDNHARMRKLIVKAFTPGVVRTLAPRIDALISELLGPALDRGAIDVVEELALPLPVTVICELLGVPARDRDLNRRWAALTMETIDPVCGDAQLQAAEAGMREWDAYIRELLASRRRRPGEALLDAMLSVEDDGAKLSDDEIAANMTFLFIAGHETTTNLVCTGLYTLLRHPDQLAKLRAEPALVEHAIEELLRYDSPVHVASRTAIETLEFEGVTIQGEQPIIVSLSSANRDARRFERPDELDITRADVKHLSFGGGAHFCPGATLARLESKLAFEQILRRTRSIELATERVTWRPSFSVRALAALPLTLQPR